MKKQKYILKNKKDFNSVHIFECGQCFRWNKTEKGSYIGVIKNAVVEITETETEVIFEGISRGDLEKIVCEYFNLKVDYTSLKDKLMLIDEHMMQSIEYGNGIRILKQEIFETIISYIISANNNIPRIKKIIENICKKYGNKVVYNEIEYYTFPTPEQLGNATVEELRSLGAGFRDKRIYDTTKKILNNEFDIEKIVELQDSKMLKEELEKLDGVGPKVADCIMLFGFNRYDVFPIDVWVRRVMNDLYIKNIDEKKVSKKEIELLANKKYGEIAGIAQQYLFYWKRDSK